MTVLSTSVQACNVAELEVKIKVCQKTFRMQGTCAIWGQTGQRRDFGDVKEILQFAVKALQNHISSSEEFSLNKGKKNSTDAGRDRQADRKIISNGNTLDGNYSIFVIITLSVTKFVVTVFLNLCALTVRWRREIVSYMFSTWRRKKSK